MAFKSAGNLKERPDDQKNNAGLQADIDQIEAFANDPANHSIDDRFNQLAAETGAAPEMDANEASNLASSSGQAAKAHRDRANQDTADALQDAHRTNKDAASALKSSSKASGIDMNRPLTAADKARFSNPEERAGLGANAGGRSKPSGRFAGWSRRKKAGVAGGGILGTILVGVIIFFVSLPFQLFHMAENLLHHNFDPGEHIQQTASKKALRILAGSSLENGGAKVTNKGPIGNRIANMKIGKFNDLLERDGIKLNFDKTTGRLVSITRNGVVEKDFTNASFWERRQAVGDLITTRIAPWRILKRTRYTQLMKFHARVSFRFWPREKVQDLDKLMTEKIRQGAGADQVTDPTTTDPKEQQKASQDGRSDAADAVKQVTDSFAKTGNKLTAIKAGISSVKARKLYGITGILALVCTVKEMLDKSTHDGYILRTDLLIRAGNLLPTVMDQTKTGIGVDMPTFGKFMGKFGGDRTAPANSEDRKPFDQSAAWKNMTGGTIITDPKNPNYTPGLSPAANPDTFALKQVTDIVDGIFNTIPGAQFGCAVVTGIFGWIMQGVEVVAAVWSGGATAAATIAGSAAISYAIFNVVLPQILQAAAGLAVTGTENATDLFSEMDAGSFLSAQDSMRSLGGRQLTNHEQAGLVDAVRQENIQIAKEKGWFWRTLSPSNSDSILTRVAMKIPTSPNRAMAAIQNIPNNFATVFGSVFLGIRPAMADVGSTTNLYGFQFYGFTDDEINKYDVQANEDVLTAPVTTKDGEITTRLDMLGNPDAYNPGDGDDTNTGDLMHCFVNKYTDTPDPICHGIGKVATRNDAQVDNPSDQEIVDTIYCKNNNVCGLTPNDDLLRYRLELLFDTTIRGIECSTNDEQYCFGGAQGPDSSITNPSGNTPSGDIQSLAKQILANKNVTFWTNNGVNTRDVFVALAAGKPAYTTCANAHGAKPDVNINILKFILEAAGKTHVMVNALTDKCHTNGSKHYSGEAVDLDLNSGPLSILEPIAKKYGGTKNYETSHHHFDFPKK